MAKQSKDYLKGFKECIRKIDNQLDNYCKSGYATIDDYRGSEKVISYDDIIDMLGQLQSEITLQSK